MKSIKDYVMTMEFKRLVGLCFSALLIASAIGEGSAQTSRRARKEQSRFGAEVAIRRPVEIPTDVLSILRETKRNQTCLKDGESPTNIISSWFAGSRIHLNDDGGSGLVVAARNSCLFGVNLVPFWVFRNTPRGHELVLSVSALGLDVLNTKTNNYRDIRASAATARRVQTIIFKFDGKEYRAQTIPARAAKSIITKPSAAFHVRGRRRGCGRSACAETVAVVLPG